MRQRACPAHRARGVDSFDANVTDSGALCQLLIERPFKKDG
jgi:hypothetical protein